MNNWRPQLGPPYRCTSITLRAFVKSPLWPGRMRHTRALAFEPLRVPRFSYLTPLNAEFEMTEMMQCRAAPGLSGVAPVQNDGIDFLVHPLTVSGSKKKTHTRRSLRFHNSQTALIPFFTMKLFILATARPNSRGSPFPSGALALLCHARTVLRPYSAKSNAQKLTDVCVCPSSVPTSKRQVLALASAKNATVVRLTGAATSVLEDNSAPLELKWAAYKSKFGKTYTGLEEQRRFNAWAENDAFIQRHNAEYAQGIHGHWVGHNEVSDLTTQEFTAKYLGTFATSPFATMDKKYKDLSKETAAAPASIDWTSKGAVTPVKNQAQCGSCWAFSTTGSLEGAHFLELGKLVSFSEQELVSCSSSAGNHGCQGGIMDNAFNWINQNGIVHESTYPYTSGGGNTGTCDQSKVAQATTFLKSHVDIPSEAQIMGGLAKQPVSIAVDAGPGTPWQLYGGGVVKSGCGSQLDHGVLIVGAGTDSGTDYWKARLSTNVFARVLLNFPSSMLH